MCFLVLFPDLPPWPQSCGDKKAFVFRWSMLHVRREHEQVEGRVMKHAGKVVFLCVLWMLIFAQRFWGKHKANSLSSKESPIVLTINADWDPLGTMWRITCHFQWFFVITSQILVGMCVYCTNKFGHVKSISSDKKTSAPIHDSCTRGIHILLCIITRMFN